MKRWILALVLATGCATTEQMQALEKKVADLETKVAELEKRPAAPGAVATDPVKEEAATKAYAEIEELIKTNKTVEAAEKAKGFAAQHGTTQVYKRARKTLDELAVVGTAIPADWATMVEKYYQGEGKVDLAKGTTLVVFWEVWCPHCQREVPKLKDTFTKFGGQGLNVVGLTRITKSATEEGVVKFIGEQAVNYPMAKENGKIAELLKVGGIPAAAVVKDGKVIWRGHPARLTEEQITGFISG